MQFRILGPLEVSVDGEAVDLGPRKQRMLFALLLINHDHTVTTDALLDAIWGDDAPGKENALWVYVSRLRSILAEVSSRQVLVTADRGYRLEIGANGRIESCTVTRSSGHSALDRATCRLLPRRGAFSPARDDTGARVKGTFSAEIVWRLP